MISVLAALVLATPYPYTPTEANVLRIPAYVLEGIALHETSHALMGKALGMKVVHFTPFPHYYKGHYYNGATVLAFDSASKRSILLVNAAPGIMDLAMFNTTDLILTQVQDSGIGMFLTCAFMGVPLLDFAYNVNNRSSRSDLSGVARYGGLSKTGIQVVGNAFVAYGIWRVYKRLTQYGE